MQLLKYISSKIICIVDRVHFEGYNIKYIAAASPKLHKNYIYMLPILPSVNFLG